jgi:glyoxylase I family protein
MPLQVEGVAPLFQVFDMPASIHFYRDLLGFEVINTSKPLSEQAGRCELGDAAAQRHDGDAEYRV